MISYRCYFDDGAVTWRVVRWSPGLRDATASTYLSDADTVSHAQQIAADDAGHSLDWEYFRDASGRVVEANSK